MFRLSNLKKILSEDVDNAAAALAKTRIKCMDFPEEGDMAEVQLFYKSFTATIVLYRRQIIKYKPKIPQIDPISATLAAVRPGCINDGIVDFTRFTFEVQMNFFMTKTNESTIDLVPGLVRLCVGVTSWATC